jgi:8-amino-7-oxononanoate synthase
MLGSNARALAAAAGLQERGFDIRAIRYPTVPEGTARLRIALNATHDEATIDRLIAALRELIAATAAA